MVGDIRSLLWWNVSGAAWSPGLWAAPGSSMGHSMAEGNGILTEPVYSDGVVCGSVPAEPSCGDVVVEPGPPKANVADEDAGEDAQQSQTKNVWCSGCWEELPDVCSCGASRWCVQCAAGLGRRSAGLRRRSVARGACKAENEAEMRDALRESMLDMTRNFQRMEQFVESMGGLASELQSVRQSMASRSDVQGLVQRLQALEGGALGEEEYDDHTGYPDDEDDLGSDDYNEDSNFA